MATAEFLRLTQNKDIKEEIKEYSKEEKLKQYVLEKFKYGREGMEPYQEIWRNFFLSYKGTRSEVKEDWQANYTTSTLKEIARVKVPLYMNILFSKRMDSFDMEPGELEDEEKIPILKDVMKYQLRNMGKKQGGFFGVWGQYLKQFELYGYTAAMCPWRKESNLKGKTTFDGADMQVLDVFHFFPDPAAVGLDSWKIIQTRDVYISHLRRQEDLGIYKNIEDLEFSGSQPAEDDALVLMDDGIPNPIDDTEADSRVELLEYHGEVPESLITGDMKEISEINPYQDKYVDAIITLANREVIIRAQRYPYDCGNIFFESCKDRMLTERFGIGTGEDIEAMTEELVNCHNKLSDAINIICNPMGIVNPEQMSGLSGTLITHPGKMFVANSMTDDVKKALSFIDTTAAASALSPLIKLIDMLDQRIMKLSQAVPSISPTSDDSKMHETLGGTQIQQANAAEPIKHIVQHELEPAWENMLRIFYKLALQKFPEQSAFRVLGKDGAEKWRKLFNKKTISKMDLQLAGDPDFIPRGVTVFSEKQVELRNLLEFLQILATAVVPATDESGQQIQSEDGKPQMEPVGDIQEVVKRIAELMDFDHIDLLLPKLKVLKDKQEAARRMNRQQEEAENNIRASKAKPTAQSGEVATNVVPPASSGTGSPTQGLGEMIRSGEGM